MDGELLWNTLYQTVMKVAAQWETTPRRGHPDQFRIESIALCWLWSAFWNQPLMHAWRQLSDPNYRMAMRQLGYQVPSQCPHETTLRRRSQRPDFQAFLRRI